MPEDYEVYKDPEYPSGDVREIQRRRWLEKTAERDAARLKENVLPDRPSFKDRKAESDANQVESKDESASKQRPSRELCDVQRVGFDVVEKEPVVVRARWGARDPVKPFEPRGAPPGRIFVVQTSSTQCHTLKECSQTLQELQEMWIEENGEDDLPYNFMVGADGRVYEGRGWEAKLPLPELLPEEYEDGTNLIIALIGDFPARKDIRPPERMVKARRDFVAYGKHIGKLFPKIRIFTEIQWKI